MTSRVWGLELRATLNPELLAQPPPPPLNPASGLGLGLFVRSKPWDSPTLNTQP